MIRAYMTQMHRALLLLQLDTGYFKKVYTLRDKILSR
jgi:hypothetical protein